MEIVFAVLAGFIAGCGLTLLLTWLLTRSHIVFLQERQRSLEAENTRLFGELTAEQGERVRLETSLEMERQAAEEKLALIAASGENLRNAFRALSAETLKASLEQFLGLARSEFERLREGAKGELEKREQAVENLVKPLAENISRFDNQIRAIENDRIQAYARLTEQVGSLITSQKELKSETGKLADALRRPEIRGRWGEIQLRKVVELAGMLDYCEFNMQQSAVTENGVQRPDLVVKLPGGRSIVVDAKTPINAYLESIDAPTESEREERLSAFARNVKDQIRNLGRKDYWKQFKGSPDLVVLFLPGEVFYSAALRTDPSLIEEGMNNRVVLAAPTTLIVLLRVAYLGWREERLAENAEHISKLGRSLYESFCVLSEHFVKLRKSLNQSIEYFNDAVGSIERNVLVKARRFPELDAGTNRDISQIEPLDIQARRIEIEEWGAGETERGDRKD